MAGTYLLRTFGTPDGPGGGTFIWTMSAWVKKTGTGGDVGIMTRYVNSAKFVKIFFNSDDQLEYAVYNSSYQARYQTTARYRDVNSWYHVVVAQNSTLATAADRVKIYVNGELITSFAVNTQIGQNIGGDFNTASAPHQIGAYNATQFFDGLMSAFNFIDNTQYAASDFGSTDATTGQWKINTNPSVTYGATGFSILNNGNTITDQSTNSNNWSEEGSPGIVSNTKDCPSNVFATGNPLIGRSSSGTNLVPALSNGNLTALADGSTWQIFKSTLGASSGKYYAEFKWISDSNTRYAYVGIYDEDNYAEKATGYPYMGDMANGYGYYSESGDYWNNSSSTSFGSSFNSSGDGIQGVAMDLDNSKLYFSKNGVWQGSGDPSNGTGGISITANRTYTFGLQLYAVGSIVFSANFGNGFFGTSAVADNSTATASTPGVFNYDVPTGYQPLSTKGLNA